jgi:hypothetical protein
MTILLNAAWSAGLAPSYLLSSMAFTDITLLIIDTRSIPNGVFVKDLELIAAFAEYADPTIKKKPAVSPTTASRTKRILFWGIPLSRSSRD